MTCKKCGDDLVGEEKYLCTRCKIEKNAKIKKYFASIGLVASGILIGIFGANINSKYNQSKPIGPPKK
jgi:hypothetical protein